MNIFDAKNRYDSIYKTIAVLLSNGFSASEAKFVIKSYSKSSNNFEYLFKSINEIFEQGYSKEDIIFNINKNPNFILDFQTQKR